MSVIDIEQLAQMTLVKQTIIGLDLGTKTIGIAVSDLGHSFANPRPVLKRKKFSIDAITLMATLKEENAGAIIIGLPINMDGSNGPRVQATRAFVRNMEVMTDIPFIFWDERLSTVAAERQLVSMDVSRAKRSQRIDSAAAAFILQGALDSLHNMHQKNNSPIQTSG